MKYKIVRYGGENDFEKGDEKKGKDRLYKEFEDLVSEHLNEGWKCQGSPKTKYFMSSGSYEVGDIEDATREYYSFEQAMINLALIYP
mgnify:CR=1 FL=1